MTTYYAVYRVLANGKHRYVSRTVTHSEKLAQEIAADLTRGEIVTPTGRIAYIRAHPHVAAPMGTYPDEG